MSIVSQSCVHFLFIGYYRYITKGIWLQLSMHEKDPVLMSKAKKSKSGCYYPKTQDTVKHEIFTNILILLIVVRAVTSENKMQQMCIFK